MNKATSRSLGSVRRPSGSNRIETSRATQSPTLVHIDSPEEGISLAKAVDLQLPMSRPWVSEHQLDVVVSPTKIHPSSNQEDPQQSLKAFSMIGLNALQKISPASKPSNRGGISHLNKSLLQYNELSVSCIEGSLPGAASRHVSNPPGIGLSKSMEQQQYEKRSISNERPCVVDIREAQSPPTSRTVAVEQDVPFSPSKRGSFLVHVSKIGRSSEPSLVKKATLDVGTSQQGSKEANISSSRVLPWQKRKRHQRAKSLEMPGYTSPISSTTEPFTPPHGHSENSEQTKTNTYNSFVRDLMELSFDKLQLPTLAKPSRTKSF